MKTLSFTAFAPVLVTVLALILAPAAGAQTFDGTVLDGGDEIFAFDAGASGQYDITVSWDEPTVNLSVFLFCRTSPSAPDILWGVSSGTRDRILTLSTGIVGPRTCFVSVNVAQGVFASDYRISFQATTNTPVPLRRLTTFPDLEGVKASARRFQEQLTAFRADLPDGMTKDGPSIPFKETVLSQIFPGSAQTFEFDVTAGGQLRVTAMWNRDDSDLRITVNCRDGSGEMSWGISESGRDRHLRFDADVLRNTTCEVRFVSQKTMVFAASIELYRDSGLVDL